MIKRKVRRQTIELSKKQFEALLKAVYLGNWMANAYRDGSADDPLIAEYEKIEDYIFSLAPQFGLEKYLDHDDADGDRYYPTGEFEETTDVHKLHKAYDENTFWDELAERLGERDFFEKYTENEINVMSEEVWFTKLHECIDTYNEEFEKFGLERVTLMKKNKLWEKMN